MSPRALMLFLSVGTLLAACASPSAAPDDGASADADADAAEAEDELRSTAKNNLSSTDEKKVLTLLDDICGDTWCEGDYDWRFKKLRCSFADESCTLTMLVVDPAYDDQPARTFWRSCKMGGLSGWTSLVDEAQNGYESLNDGFYDEVSDCIDRLESRIPPR